MACINMFNDHQPGSFCGPPPPISPRISFSNDFAVEPPPPRNAGTPVDPDFEFAVGGRPMIAADELFFKGRMLPLRDTCPTSTARVTTLRDELREGCDDWSRPPKGSPRWKEFLSFRRAYGSSLVRKCDKGDGSSAAAAAASAEVPMGASAKFPQEVKGNGGRRARKEDMEIEL